MKFKDNVKKTLFILMRIFPIQKNKIVITSFYGKGYGDSSKYICEYLIKNYKNKIKIIWLVNDTSNNNLPKEIKAIKYKSLRSIYERVTAKIWIDNARKHSYELKRKKQYYIQLWHSSLRLKKIEKDAINYLPEIYIKNAIHDSKMIDLMVSGCEFSYNTYKNSFWYNGKILKSGTPRCDILLNKDVNILKKIICKKYSINENDKLILYAPTFRKGALNNHNNIDFEKIINEYSKNGDNCTILVRYHPNSKIKFEDKSNIKNVTLYDDIQELIAISDIMITDYSGCCFDMGIAKKLCILYVEDLDEDLKKERELYFNFDELPFPKAKSNQEIITILKNLDYNKYQKTLNKFYEKIGSYENGNASEIVSKHIMKVINNEGKKI